MKQCFENHSHIWQIQFHRGLGVAWISREVSVIGLGNNQRFFCAPKYYITYTKWVKAAIGVVGRSVINLATALIVEMAGLNTITEYTTPLHYSWDVR